MALFSGKSRDQKAREWAAKKGIDVADAVAVDKTFHDERNQLLAVWHGRVDHHVMSKPGAMMRGRTELTSITPDKIGTVQVEHRGISGVLRIAGSGVALEYVTTQKDAERLAQAVRSVM